MSPTHPMMAMAPLRGMSAPRIPIRPGPMGRGDYGEYAMRSFPQFDYNYSNFELRLRLLGKYLGIGFFFESNSPSN